MKKYSVVLLLMTVLFSCMNDETLSSGYDINYLVTEHTIADRYSFSEKNTDSYTIDFEAKTLQEGDLFRLIHSQKKDTTEIQINVLPNNKATVTLPQKFISGQYYTYFVRNNATQSIGMLTINIKRSDIRVKGVKVVAHRGGSRESGLPDNSIAGLKHAISIGIYASECDIYITKDDKVIVAHSESDEDAIYDGKIIYESTYQELKKTKRLENGESLPLLEDFIEVIMDSDSIKLWVDVKSIGKNIPKNNVISARAGVKAVEIIKELGAESRVEFIIGRKSVLDVTKGAIDQAWDVAYMNTTFSPRDFINAGLNWAHFDLSKGFYQNTARIDNYKAEGIRISVYNADTDSEMKFFLEQEISAISTNYPEKLLKKIKSFEKSIGVDQKINNQTK